jgi:DNA-binding protein HU-beta
MNKAELVAALANKTGFTKVATEATLNAFTDVVAEAIGKGEVVQLLGFGQFKTASRAARQGRNPQTGASMPIPATTVPKFVPGSELRRNVAAAANPGKGKGKSAAKTAKPAAAKPAKAKRKA